MFMVSAKDLAQISRMPVKPIIKPFALALLALLFVYGVNVPILERNSWLTPYILVLCPGAIPA
jgi:hypothetical protein